MNRNGIWSRVIMPLSINIIIIGIDVKKAANNVARQTVDVIEAAKGKKRRGRKSNYRHKKTNNNKSIKK